MCKKLLFLLLLLLAVACQNVGDIDTEQAVTAVPKHFPAVGERIRTYFGEETYRDINAENIALVASELRDPEMVGLFSGSLTFRSFSYQGDEYMVAFMGADLVASSDFRIGYVVFKADEETFVNREWWWQDVPAGTDFEKTDPYYFSISVEVDEDGNSAILNVYDVVE